MLTVLSFNRYYWIGPSYSPPLSCFYYNTSPPIGPTTVRNFRSNYNYRTTSKETKKKNKIILKTVSRIENNSTVPCRIYGIRLSRVCTHRKRFDFFVLFFLPWINGFFLDFLSRVSRTPNIVSAWKRRHISVAVCRRFRLRDSLRFLISFLISSRTFIISRLIHYRHKMRFFFF